MESAAFDEFNRILSFIEELSGISLPESNYNPVKRYIEEKTSEYGLGVDDYLQLLKNNKPELDDFLDTVTISETYFFREQKHFRLLAGEILPGIRNRNSGVLKIWSAACSTGEEAVSLAALAASGVTNSGIEVYASDINPLALTKLERGVYGGNSFREDGSEFHELLHSPPLGANSSYHLPNHLSKLIFPSIINLSEDDYSDIPSDMNIIFLRNMLIYVKSELRVKILDNIVSHLSPGGYLFLSSSEIPLLGHVELVLEARDGCYFFRKKSLKEKSAGLIAGKEVLSRRESSRIVFLERKPDAAATPVKLADILSHISLRLNNPLYEDSDKEAFDAALDYLETVVFLNSGDLDKAEEAAGRLIKKWGENEVTDYFLGIKALREHLFVKAVDMFNKALKKNSGFWPALYQRALIEKDLPDGSACNDFNECLKSIDLYIRRGVFIYQFLLEGFNAKYFAGICEGWMAKLESEGACHGA